MQKSLSLNLNFNWETRKESVEFPSGSRENREVVFRVPLSSEVRAGGWKEEEEGKREGRREGGKGY